MRACSSLPEALAQHTSCRQVQRTVVLQASNFVTKSFHLALYCVVARREPAEEEQRTLHRRAARGADKRARADGGARSQCAPRCNRPLVLRPACVGALRCSMDLPASIRPAVSVLLVFRRRV